MLNSLAFITVALSMTLLRHAFTPKWPETTPGKINGREKKHDHPIILTD
jgi:hypothetical protein